MDRKNIYILLWLSMAGLVSSQGQVATGGTYTLDQSVISNGGGTSAGSTYSLVGTTGQNIAGTRSTGSSYSLSGGFWQVVMSPTAAEVGIGGRVLTNNGAPVSRAVVTFTGSNGTTRVSISNYFGYYRVDGLEAGQAFLVTVSAKRLQFVPRIMMIQDNLADFDLVML